MAGSGPEDTQFDTRHFEQKLNEVARLLSWLLPGSVLSRLRRSFVLLEIALASRFMPVLVEPVVVRISVFSKLVFMLFVGTPGRINAAELASYDQVKQTILKIPGFTDNVVTHILSGLGAGFFDVYIGSLVDVL